MDRVSYIYTSLEGAYFRIFTADMTEIVNDEYDATNKGYKSPGSTLPLTFSGATSDAMVTSFINWMKEHSN